MSPIGRVFTVINLILAGTFVFMAGTFLQKHTEYKARYDASQEELAALQQKLGDREAELRGEINRLDREHRIATSNLETTTTENQRLTAENQNLESQLADLSGDIKQIVAHSASMDETVNQAFTDAKLAFERATTAIQERDQAVADKQAADAALAAANRRADALEQKIATLTGDVESLRQENGEQQVLLTWFNTRFPGAIVMAQPVLHGVVEDARGNICTIRVTSNPSNAEIKPGYTLVIYNGQTYKGEAMITEVDGEFAFCTITKTRPGVTIAPGDDAASRV